MTQLKVCSVWNRIHYFVANLSLYKQLSLALTPVKFLRDKISPRDLIKLWRVDAQLSRHIGAFAVASAGKLLHGEVFAVYLPARSLLASLQVSRRSTPGAGPKSRAPWSGKCARWCPMPNS
jgi:hypothetical protein